MYCEKRDDEGVLIVPLQGVVKLSLTPGSWGSQRPGEVRIAGLPKLLYGPRHAEEGEEKEAAVAYLGGRNAEVPDSSLMTANQSDGP